MRKIILHSLLALACAALGSVDQKKNAGVVAGRSSWDSWSGIYPHLAMTNREGECGTGAVVPWAGALWVVTYGPHCPCGSSDKLYEIKPDLSRVIRPESVGGTPANRILHRETGKLSIGNYLVASNGAVETVWISRMPGRLTGAARHLTDPAHKIYVTDMEEALYELDLTTARTRTLIRDGFNRKAFEAMFKRWHRTPPPGWFEAEESTLFGYHGKGTCSGFGKVFYANNGETSQRARQDPTTPAGCLAFWQPGMKNWELIRTNQFTEVTTRDGVYGNEHPSTNAIWALGWDHRSVILTTTSDGTHWSDFRLPKGTHTYDGAHGWHTEWPRIRAVGAGETGDELLATMHGTFWKFPADFAPGNAAGVRPHSTYLKVVGDFCGWQGRIVFGCDDHARDAFTNVRDLKGGSSRSARPSESNLWFVEPSQLDRLGRREGKGAVWCGDRLRSGQASDPFLFAGYDRKWLWLTVRAKVQLDPKGDGQWTDWKTLNPGGHDLTSAPAAEWVRLVCSADEPEATAVFHYTQQSGAQESSRVFERLAPKGAEAVFTRNEPVPQGLIGEDAASLYYDDRVAKKRWRLPRLAKTVPATCGRLCREVATERDLLHVGGIFYELPAVTAGGFKYVRAIAGTRRAIDDYDTWKGLLVVREQGRLYAGALDDVWQLGAPQGIGGPWKSTRVTAGMVSEPYLMNGFCGVKELEVRSDVDMELVFEADIDGCGRWLPVTIHSLLCDLDGGVISLRANETRRLRLPDAFAAYWVRFRSSAAGTVTAQFAYSTNTIL